MYMYMYMLYIRRPVCTRTSMRAHAHAYDAYASQPDSSRSTAVRPYAVLSPSTPPHTQMAREYPVCQIGTVSCPDA